MGFRQIPRRKGQSKILRRHLDSSTRIRHQRSHRRIRLRRYSLCSLNIHSLAWTDQTLLRLRMDNGLRHRINRSNNDGNSNRNTGNNIGSRNHRILDLDTHSLNPHPTFSIQPTPNLPSCHSNIQVTHIRW